jgi:hypothetical protein
MKNFLNLDFGAALKRIFGSEKKAEQQAAAASSAESARKPLEHEIEAAAPAILTIWTIERNRYAPARALCTDIEVYPSAAITLCEDIQGYVFDTPNGESVVVEARTGSLVGHSVEVVRDGICEMTKAQLNNQLDTGRKDFNRMKNQEMSNDEFWTAIKMGSEETEAAHETQDY